MATLRKALAATVFLVLATTSVHGSSVGTDESKWHEATVVPKLSKVTEDSAGHTWRAVDAGLTESAVPSSQGINAVSVESNEADEDLEKYRLRPALVEAATPDDDVAGGPSRNHIRQAEIVNAPPAKKQAPSPRHSSPALRPQPPAPTLTPPHASGSAVASEHMKKAAVPVPLSGIAVNPAHKLNVEVYVMALCPYCHDWILGFNNAVMNPSLGIAPYLNLRVRFVVRSNNTLAETGDVALDDMEFKCLHGDVECDTDTIMLCAMRDSYESGNGQDSFWPFLVEMEKNREGNETDSYVDVDLAPEFGLNGDAIEECRSGQLGKHLLLAEALHCEQKGIFSTPTVFYNGAEYQPDDDDYLGQVCQAMRNASLPVIPGTCNGVAAPSVDGDNSTDVGSGFMNATKTSKKSVASLQEMDSSVAKLSNSMRGGKVDLHQSIYQGPIDPPGAHHRHTRKEVDNDVVVQGKPMVPPPAPPPPGKKGFWRDLFTRGFERAVEDIAGDIAKGAHGLEGMLVGSSGTQQ